MPREFEDPGELEDPEDLEDVLDPGLFLGLNDPGAREVRGLRLGAEKEKRHEEWHDGQDINNVHPVLEELYLLWRPCQPVKETILTSRVLIIDTMIHRYTYRPDEIFQDKPGYANCFNQG